MPTLARSIQEITVILILKSFERVVEKLKQLRILKYLFIKITFFNIARFFSFFFLLFSFLIFVGQDLNFGNLKFPSYTFFFFFSLFGESSSYILSVCHQRFPEWAIKNDYNDVVLKILKMKQNKKENYKMWKHTGHVAIVRQVLGISFLKFLLLG